MLQSQLLGYLCILGSNRLAGVKECTKRIKCEQNRPSSQAAHVTGTQTTLGHSLNELYATHPMTSMDGEAQSLFNRTLNHASSSMVLLLVLDVRHYQYLDDAANELWPFPKTY